LGLSDIQIKALKEADPEMYYVLVAKNVHSFAYLKACKEGFILPVHHPQINNQLDRFQPENMTPKILFLPIWV
jgi:hypothetical protein